MQSFKINTISIHARLTLVLSCATRAKKIFEIEYLEVYEYTNFVLEQCEQWIQYKNIKASDLYLFIQKFYEYEQNFKNQLRYEHALFTILSAVYYVVRRANLYDTKQALTKIPLLPNDMAEINEDIVIHCLQYFYQTFEHEDKELKWLENVIGTSMKNSKKHHPSSKN